MRRSGGRKSLGEILLKIGSGILAGRLSVFKIYD